uniref:glycosyltransferase family 4 protein n=1 Tax=uncultured Tenacibaculum sp. TaxID=174713 RepID=UPI00261C2149|nr:glycosyltransferase family 4 protein [uncultured Tenacibaculum sp.]
MESNKRIKKLLIVVNVDWFFLSHRLPIAQRALKEGWDVYLAAQDTGKSETIKKHGVKFINIPLSRSGTSLLEEFKTIKFFFKVYNKVKPDIVHHVTMKPVIYGSLVSKITKVKGTLNAISGMGYNFTSQRKSLVQRVMLKLMKIGFNQENLAFVFQNNDDFLETKNLRVLGKDNEVFFIKGSGVDLKVFNKSELIKKEKINILFPARMLWDKGVLELIKASETLKDKYKNKVVFILAGLADDNNKAGVNEKYLKDNEVKGYLEWVGYQENMIEVYKKSDIVVLPSYREGMPKSLIEACAIGRPIVTTEAVGCKECVDEGINGFKVPVKSIKELARAIEKLILSEELRESMGNNSRVKAENEFSIESVVDKHLDIYKTLYEK